MSNTTRNPLDSSFHSHESSKRLRTGHVVRRRNQTNTVRLNFRPFLGITLRVGRLWAPKDDKDDSLLDFRFFDIVDEEEEKFSRPALLNIQGHIYFNITDCINF